MSIQRLLGYLAVPVHLFRLPAPPQEIIDTTSFELHDEDFKALNTKDYQLR